MACLAMRVKWLLLVEGYAQLLQFSFSVHGLWLLVMQMKILPLLCVFSHQYMLLLGIRSLRDDIILRCLRLYYLSLLFRL